MQSRIANRVAEPRSPRSPGALERLPRRPARSARLPDGTACSLRAGGAGLVRDRRDRHTRTRHKADLQESTEGEERGGGVTEVCQSPVGKNEGVVGVVLMLRLSTLDITGRLRTAPPPSSGGRRTRQDCWDWRGEGAGRGKWRRSSRMRRMYPSQRGDGGVSSRASSFSRGSGRVGGRNHEPVVPITSSTTPRHRAGWDGTGIDGDERPGGHRDGVTQSVGSRSSAQRARICAAGPRIGA